MSRHFLISRVACMSTPSARIPLRTPVSPGPFKLGDCHDSGRRTDRETESAQVGERADEGTPVRKAVPAQAARAPVVGQGFAPAVGLLAGPSELTNVGRRGVCGRDAPG